MNMMNALATVPLFSELTPDQLGMIAVYLRRRSFEEREVIVRRDTPGDALYILISGKVKVCYPDDEGETIITVLSEGDFFGELSVLDGEGRSADVVALEPTVALMLAAEDVHASIVAFPSIAIALLRELAGRLRRSTEWIHSLSCQDVYGRIAAQLLHLSEMLGVDAPEGGGRLIRLRLTQNDLASLVGASRESVNKAMGYFKSKNYISVDGLHQITVYDRDALQKRCQ